MQKEVPLSPSDSTQSNDDPEHLELQDRSIREASVLYKNSPNHSSASSTEYLMSTAKSRRRRELKPIIRKQSRSRGLKDHYEAILAPAALQFSPSTPKRESPVQTI
jgi:hypothetical protein